MRNRVRSHFQEFDHSDIARESADAMDAERAAWCAVCDGPTELDENGFCVACVQNGDAHDVESVVPEGVPSTSPRSIECSLCGADIGEYCRPGSDGAGYNHSARVEKHEDDRDVVARRPVHA